MKCVDGNLVPSIVVSDVDDVDGCELETDANENRIAENQDDIASVGEEIIEERSGKQSITNNLTAFSGADDATSIASSNDDHFHEEERVVKGKTDSPDVSEPVDDDSPHVSESVDEDKNNESVGEENSFEEIKNEVIVSFACPTRAQYIYHDGTDVSVESIDLSNLNDDQVNGHACLKNESSEETKLSSQFIDRGDDIERVLEIKEAFKACLKSKRQLLDLPRGRIETILTDDDESEYDDEEDSSQEHFKQYTTFVDATHDTIEPSLKQFEPEDTNSIETNEGTLTNKTKIEHSSVDPTQTMPETRDVVETREGDGCVSPTLGFATCRYRWEKTIYTQEDKVCFVTLNSRVSGVYLHL